MKAKLTVTLAFLLGAAVGLAVAKKKSIPADAYRGKAPEAAAAVLLTHALNEAENGSWENIAVARVHILGGQADEGHAILDRVLGPKAEASDWIRAGRIYFEAGDWDRARDAFERVVEEAPKDEDWLAEIGAYYNLSGDRERAEELFDRSFALGHGLGSLLEAAGSYLGVPPE